jgi:hypothetical protein
MLIGVGGIWLSLEERSPFLEEDSLPVVEVRDTAAFWGGFTNFGDLGNAASCFHVL